MESIDFTRQLHVLKGQTDMASHVSLSDQRSMTIELSEIGVQRAIADVLGALDDKIAVNEKTAGLVANLARARFVHTVADGETARVGELIELMSRGSAPEYVDDGGMLVVNQKCIRDQSVSLSPARRTAFPTKRTDRIVRQDDVLVNSTGQGTLGRVARWTRSEQVVTVDSHITIVRFDPRLVDPACAGYGLLEIESEIEGLAEGSTGQTELRRDLLGGLTIRIPHDDAQLALGAELRQFDSFILSLRAQSERLARTRDELLPLLMSGKVRLADGEAAMSEVV